MNGMIGKNILNQFSRLLAVLFFIPGLAISGPAPQASAASCGDRVIVFLPSWYEGLCKEGTKSIMSPSEMLPNSNDTGQQLGAWLSLIAFNIVTIILYLVAYVSLFFIIWGGFKYMTQGDNSSGITAARKTIQNAIIGLILSILSVAIVQFIVGSIKQ